MRKREQQIFGINATILIVSIWLLMIFTFSPPEDWKQGMYGTQAIMSPSAIKALKLVSRSICLGLLCFATFRLLREPRSGRMTIVFLPVLAFTFWIFASVYWSPLKTVSLQQAISFTVSIILAFVFANSWRSCKDTSIYFMHLCGVLILISTGLLFLYIFAPQYGALTKQASGMFHSTTAGASASLGLLCNLGMFGIYRFRWSIWLLLPSIAVHVPVLILAGNRFSILLTMLFAILIVLAFFRKHELAVFAMATAVIGVVYLTVDTKLKAPDFAVKKVETYTMQGQSKVQFRTISGRTEMWDVMWRSYQKSPWIGHGYFVTSETGRVFVWDEWGNWTAHNMYLQVLVTTGLIGAMLFLVGMFMPIMGLMTLDRTLTKQDQLLYRLLLLLILWFASWGLLNSSVVGPTQPESVVFALVYGLGMRASYVAWVNREVSQAKFATTATA